MLGKIQRKLSSTRGRIAKEWQKYRQTKKKILSRKRLSADQKRQVILSELDLTRQRISSSWHIYKEQKYAVTHRSPYYNLSLVKTLTGVHKQVEGKKVFFKFKDTTQKIYKADRKFDVDKLDVIVPQILEEPRVKGVLVVFEITSEETGQRTHVSNYITSDLMDIINEREESVYEYVVKRFQAGSTKDYNLRFIYIRVVYAKS